jgi:hypothetical protein
MFPLNAIAEPYSVPCCCCPMLLLDGFVQICVLLLSLGLGWVRADMRALFSLLCPMLLQVDLWLEGRKHQNSCFS